MSEITFNEDIRDGIQEIANLAVGEAADRVARSFSAFVKLPLPNVHLIEAADILMTLGAVCSQHQVTAVTQAFYGPGISGEALLLFTDASLRDLASLMGYEVVSDHQQAELVLEMASLLNGSCVLGFCNKLDITVLLKHPAILAQHASLQELVGNSQFPWKTTLCIELNYAFESYNIACDLIILFHEQSLPTLFEQISVLLE